MQRFVCILTLLLASAMLTYISPAASQEKQEEDNWKGKLKDGTIITREDLSKILEAHKKWYKTDGKEGEQANLRKADLRKADLRKVNLIKANLTEANLKGANLTEANLGGATLTKANLEVANLTKTYLVTIYLGKSNLVADLTEANLEEANLTEANLWGVTLSKANLGLANLTRAYLFKANLIEAKLWDANLTRAFLKDATLSKVDLGGATMIDADLQGANLTEAKLWDANLTRAFLKDATLSKVDLGGATMIDADLQGANLTEANLGGATLTKANLEVANLTRAYVAEANLTEVNLEEANLTGADLSGSDLSKADLKKAIISNETKLIGANLEGAFFWQVQFPTNLNFEPKAASLPYIPAMATAYNLSSLTFMELSHGLVELREGFKKAGLQQQERAITYAIEHTKRVNRTSADPFSSLFSKKEREETSSTEKPSFWKKLGNEVLGWISYVFVELTCAYGMKPWNALFLLVGLIPLFSITYMVFLHKESQDGIWQVWNPERMRKDLGEEEGEKLLSLRGWPAMRIGFYFSILSAFSIGWRELNVGNWIARLQRHEYNYRATGWARTVSGFQSLLSVYLLAIWALTYFGRPFE